MGIAYQSSANLGLTPEAGDVAMVTGGWGMRCFGSVRFLRGFKQQEIVQLVNMIAMVTMFVLLKSE